MPEHKELGLLKGAYTGGILYIPAMYAEMQIDEMAKARTGTNQVTFQQVEKHRPQSKTYLSTCLSSMPRTTEPSTKNFCPGLSKLDQKRLSGPSTHPQTVLESETKGTHYQLRPPQRHSLGISIMSFGILRAYPVIPKGVLTVEDARIAVSMGAPAIILSNHGARHVDTVPSPLRVALAIHDEAPEIFSETEALADCGVRYGTDALKLLALGCKAVGLGRSFMYANIYGQAGVEKAIELLKTEMTLDAINLGVTDLKQLNSSWVSHIVPSPRDSGADNTFIVGSYVPSQPSVGPVVASLNADTYSRSNVYCPIG